MTTNIELDSLINLLTLDDKIELLRQQLKIKPIVDIETFLIDPYYLGGTFGINPETGKPKVFQCWLDKLKNEVYPNSLQTNSYIVVHGSIGCGKTTFSKIVLAYDMYKLTRMENPGNFFELVDKTIWIKIWNVYKWKAQVMIDELWDIISKSPYFQECYKDPNNPIQRIQLGAAGRLNDLISDDVISVCLSELNFANSYVAQDIIDTVVSRIESRYQKGKNLFTHAIMDSSDTTEDSVIERFIKYSPYAKNALVYSVAIWDAKPHLYFKHGSFLMYAGSSKIKAHVIQEGEDTSEYDPDRIFEAPNEVLDLALSDPDKMIQEKAGRSIVSTDQFMDPERVTRVFTIDKIYNNVEFVDFYNPNDTFIEILRDSISKLPTDRQLYGRIDLGVSGDRTGLAIGYIEDLHATRREGTIQYDPDIVVPIALGISRLPGQETAIQKLIDLILYIHNEHPFYLFTTDQFQSTQIRQSLTLNKINNYSLSVDRTDEPYIAFKNMIYRGKVRLPKNEILINELCNLTYIDGRVDHHPYKNANLDEGSDSKDIADAVAGIVYEMTKATEEVMELPITNNPNMIDDYTKAISELIEQKTKDFFIHQYTGMYQGM